MSALRLELGRVAAVAWKDLRAERRALSNFSAVTAFAVVMLVLFGFALGADVAALRAAAAGIVWLSVLFSGVLAFNRSFQIELEDAALDELLLYPGDRRSLFLGKVAGGVVFLLIVESVILTIATVLYGLALGPALPGLFAVIGLGTLGLVSLGMFYSAMSSRLRSREALLPLLLFPMLVPLLLAAINGTTALLAGDPMGEATSWLSLLIVFDLVFFTAAFLAFDAIMEE